MHYLQEVIHQVDKTHPHLGNPVAMAMLTIKAKKMLILVSPRGCGKSRVSSFVGLSYPGHELQDRMSVAGLAAIRERLNGFQSVLVVDDIAKTQTAYARITTLTTLAELVYSHYCISHLAGTNYEITDFYGSALVNIQPVLLREVVKSPEWEASMQDKSIRYYHLFRPLEPNPMPPEVRLQWGYNLDKVAVPLGKGKLVEQLKAIGETQWGLSRLVEHTKDLLRACAAYDKRYKVTSADYRLLIKLLNPMVIENLITDKKEFESERYLNSNQLAILTEFVTYGNFTLRQMSRDYKLSESQCRKIMSRYSDTWVETERRPTTYAPSKALTEKLKEVGIK